MNLRKYEQELKRKYGLNENSSKERNVEGEYEHLFYPDFKNFLGSSRK